MTQIIIDLDGTIFNVSARNYACYLHVMAKIDTAPLPFEAYWALKRSCQKIDTLDFDWKTIIEDPALLALDTLQDGVFEKLTAWHNQKHTLILATRRQNPAMVDLQLKQHKIDMFFSHLVVNPAQDKAASVTEKLSVNAATAIWIGDTEDDAQAAHKIGCQLWLVTNGMRDTHFLTAFKPDRCVDSFNSLPLSL